MGKLPKHNLVQGWQKIPAIHYAIAGMTGLWLLSRLTVASASPGTVCLSLSDIDHTEVMDDSTILFDMKDQAVWENLLPQACTGLKTANGFEYTGMQPKICSNSDRIHVVDSDTVCALGPFVLSRAR